MTRKQARRWSAAVIGGLMAAGACLAALTAKDYGVAWDDYVQTRYGELVLDYFASGGRNSQCNEFLDLKVYAPTFEVIAALASKLAPGRLIEIRHLLTALTALLALPALWGVGKLLGNPWLGVVAAAALCLTPAWYGHAYVNSKDIPFAVGYAWSMLALSAMFARGRFDWREMLVCGLVVGLTVSVRPGGWMLLLATYAALAIWFDWRQSSQGASVRRRTLLKQGCLLLVAWLVMVLPWPWAHENPVLHPLQAIRAASQFHIVVPVLFGGETIPSNELPRHYLLVYLLITLPPALLILAGIGLITSLATHLRRLDHPRTTVQVALAVWLGLPLAIFAVLRPNTYDGLRHFLFVLPAVAVWGGIGCQWLWKQIRFAPLRWSFALALALSAGVQVDSLVGLHPYQMTYFNCLVGGEAKASRRYDTETWLTSYKEAMEWIRRQPRPVAGEPIDVLVAANDNSRWCAAYYADEEMRVTTTRSYGQPGDLPPGIDYYVGTSRSAMNTNFPLAPVVLHIQRQGAIFTTVRQAARNGQPAAN